MAPQTISRETLVPLGAAIAALVIVIGGILWLTEIFAIANSNLEKIDRIESEIGKIEESRTYYRSRLWESIWNQDERLARIEGKLDVLIEDRPTRGVRP